MKDLIKKQIEILVNTRNILEKEAQKRERSYEEKIELWQNNKFGKEFEDKTFDLWDAVGDLGDSIDTLNKLIK